MFRKGNEREKTCFALNEITRVLTEGHSRYKKLYYRLGLAKADFQKTSKTNIYLYKRCQADEMPNPSLAYFNSSSKYFYKFSSYFKQLECYSFTG